MWMDMHDTPITTAIPADIKAKRLEKYLKRIDEYRADRGAPPIWVGTKVTFAARQYQLKDAREVRWHAEVRLYGIRDGTAETRRRVIVPRKSQNA